ncbi:MAG: hypothetical protein ACODAA_03820 [Gemmatimonadota bacterium]
MTTEGMEHESVSGLDPWGLRRIEKLLAELEGVGSLKIVPDGHGGIDEVHVLSGSSLSPKQIVRNIESALLAEFGLQIDHRKISIAQTRAPEISPAQALQTEEMLKAEEAAAGVAVAPGTAVAGAPARTILKDVHIERMAGREFSCRVEVEREGETYIGEAEGPDFERSRMEISAAACLDALQMASGEGIHLSLQGVSQLQSLGRTFVVVVVGAAVGRDAETLSGNATVNDSVEEAAVLACLMATNRWLGVR